MVVVSSLLLQRGVTSKIFSIFLIISGVGAIGVAIFPMNIQPIHGIFQLIAMLFGAFSAIISSRIEKFSSPLSIIFLFLGVFSLIASVVFYPYLGLSVGDTATFLGLGKGVMERLGIYPILLWIIGFGFYLMARTKE
jgi:hypothetical membrane protein